LALGFAAIDEATPMPDLWAPFLGLAEVPTLVARGALSTILSEATVTEMLARHPRCEALTIADEGHAPLFDDPASLDGLIGFLDRVGA
jgi:pimeloyl-ACP methyl ester carboxylesterase